MQNLDLDCLRTFLACVGAASFAEAGLKVHKSQSTVSMQIRRLEETVGKALFAKRGRKNHVTAAGRELAEYAERLVRLNDEAVGRFAERNFEGRLVIGTCDDYAEAFLPDVFAPFAARYPMVEVSIECRPSTDITGMVDAGELDLGIVTLEPRMRGVEHLASEPLCWAAPVGRRLELERPLPLALWQPGCIWRGMALEALDDDGVPYRIAYTGWSAAALMTTVRAGLAVSPLARRFPMHGLRLVDDDAGLPRLGSFDVGLLRAREGPNALKDAFAQEIVEAFARRDATESLAA